MSKIVFRFLKKQKLLLGVLWLMLRGNETASAQQIYTMKMCYKMRPDAPTFHFAGDLSVSEKVKTSSFSNASTVIQFGLNHRKSVLGFEMEFLRTDTKTLVGPYFRVFPLDQIRKPITLMLELKYLSPVNQSSHNVISISSGIIVSNHEFFGVEIYESFTSDLSITSGFSFFTGIKIHYYFFIS